jgi:nicotinamide riboside kinase
MVENTMLSNEAGAQALKDAPVSLPERVFGGVRRIAVLGAECTGKSQICQALAKRLPGLALAEVLREWVSCAGRTPNPDEQWQVFERQRQAEEQALLEAERTGQAWVVCDSAPLMTAIYSLHYHADDRLIAPALEHHAAYSMTLVCADDIPWVADPGQRDGESVRQAVQARLHEIVRQHCLPAVAVSGLGPQRLKRALEGLGFAQAGPAHLPEQAIQGLEQWT